MYIQAFDSQQLCFTMARAIVLILVMAVLVSGSTVGAQEAALLFDGVNDVATIADPSGWSSSIASLTIEVWLRPTDVSGSSFGGVVTDDATITLAQHFSDNSTLVWSISLGPTDGVVTPAGSLAVGRWDHFACTYDGSIMRIFHNGSPAGEIVHSVGGPLTIGQEIYIGRWPSAASFPGVIDEVRIWNEVRTQADIERWMTLPLSGSEPGLLGYWRLDEGTGQTFMDGSTFGNDGVLGPTSAVEPEDPQWTSGVPHIAFFFDGFESSDTSAWSVTIPR